MIFTLQVQIALSEMKNGVGYVEMNLLWVEGRADQKIKPSRDINVIFNTNYLQTNIE